MMSNLRVCIDIFRVQYNLTMKTDPLSFYFKIKLKEYITSNRMGILVLSVNLVFKCMKFYVLVFFLTGCVLYSSQTKFNHTTSNESSGIVLHTFKTKVPSFTSFIYLHLIYIFTTIFTERKINQHLHIVIDFC